jgi:hypothetical protein
VAQRGLTSLAEASGVLPRIDPRAHAGVEVTLVQLDAELLQLGQVAAAALHAARAWVA